LVPRDVRYGLTALLFLVCMAVIPSVVSGDDDAATLAESSGPNVATASTGYVEPHPEVTNELLEVPPVIPDEVMRQADTYFRGEIIVPVDPTVDPKSIAPTCPATEPRAAQGTKAPDDFVIFRNTALDDLATNNSTSRINEPSLGVNQHAIFYTGNWYASVSSDGGNTWSYINPYDNFPANGINDPVNGGFCCDQIVYYEESRDVLFWLLQYSNDGITNTQRIAVANSASDITTNTWYWYDFTPASFGFPATGKWLDFPDLSVSDNNLYLTTNVFDIGSGSTSTAVIARLDLDDMAQGVGVSFSYLQTDRPGLRCTHGATSTMYWGAHNSNTSIRIYRWDEGSGTIFWDDVTHAAYNAGTFVAPGPDGRDWAGRGDSRILGAWVANSVIGFMWGAAQGGSFPYPHTQVKQFQESDRSLISEAQVWSTVVGWLYPSVHPNDRGHLGGSIAFGGGNYYPSTAVWIADDVNGGSFGPLETAAFANGNSGPLVNVWGDYLASRRHFICGNTWSASGFSLRDGGFNGNAVPRYAWFGRERDVCCECVYQSDFDEDGFRTSLDLASLIDILFAGAFNVQDDLCPSPRGDFDCDGYTTPLDMSGLIDHLFLSGPGPCQPCLNPDPECIGAVCGSSPPCSGPRECASPFCVSTADGGGACIDGSIPCAGLIPCPGGTGDCPPGSVCAVNTCCGAAYCIPKEGLCGPSSAPPAGASDGGESVQAQPAAAAGPTVGGCYK
jgi:hypothetical protein